MKLSLLTNLYKEIPLHKTLSIMNSLGISVAEIGAGGFPGKEHCDPSILLNNKAEFFKFREAFNVHSLDICSLSVHGNPVHPNKELAEKFDNDFKNAVLLAEQLEIDTVNTFSGCPGDSENSKYPNWVTCPWPEDFQCILDWQWNQVLIPYWREAAEFAKSHGVTKIAMEMHPGFCVYNPETLLRLRSEIGDIIGANLDPSHLIWQGIDMTAAINALSGAIYNVHAKDTKINKYNVAENGVLDTKAYSEISKRAWTFRTVGFGNSEMYWRDFVSALRMSGYDGAVSIEHEDRLISVEEGLKSAVSLLKPIIEN